MKIKWYHIILFALGVFILPAVFNAIKAQVIKGGWFPKKLSPGGSPGLDGKRVNESLMFGGRSRKDGPVGIRNNNPGNLRDTGIQWVGCIGSADGFEVFDTMKNGVRALMSNMQFHVNHGASTISKLTAVWAPKGDGDNDPIVYAKNVAAGVGLGINSPIELQVPAQFVGIAKGITLQECGSEWALPVDLIWEGLEALNA